ncbi:MAG: hypothetical protein FWF46_06180 [Oscillospiraceae bacterium]|nr:hypothetical protein [Oscillospiraceae bacterium]
MIKRILIVIIILLLAFVTFTLLKNGMTVLGYSVYSIPQIQQTSKDLDDKIEQSNELNKVTFQSKNDELSKALTDLVTEEKNYQDALNQSTKDQINKANTAQTYEMEFLWTKIGNYATSNKITLTMDVTTGAASDVKNLNFTVRGSYRGITNFVSNLENDPKLVGFKIEGFNLAPDTVAVAATDTSNGTDANSTTPSVGLVGTFTIKGISINI